MRSGSHHITVMEEWRQIKKKTRVHSVKCCIYIYAEKNNTPTIWLMLLRCLRGQVRPNMICLGQEPICELPSIGRANSLERPASYQPGDRYTLSLRLQWSRWCINAAHFNSGSGLPICWGWGTPFARRFRSIIRFMYQGIIVGSAWRNLYKK